MDLTDKVCDQASESEEMSPERSSPERVSLDGTVLKTCVDCGTSKTPLWRGGPAGPKSLCNACGIRSRKKRRALMGINKEDKKPKKSMIVKHNMNTQVQQIMSTTSSSNTSTSSSEESSSKCGGNDSKNALKNNNLLAFGGKVAYQRPRSNSMNQRRKLGEVEQAAFLLMALSCGSVY